VWFLQEPHGVSSLKIAFSIVTAMKTSNLTQPVYTVRVIMSSYRYTITDADEGMGAPF
jgi:hypothetical protein